MSRIRIAASLEGLSAHLDHSRRGFRVETVPLAAAGPWRLVDGAITHESGGFFNVIGIEFADQPGQGDVFLYQLQSAITGLLRTTIEGEQHFLLQARAEPGTYGIAQYGPTIQSTPANYLRLHGGMATPFVEYFSTHMPNVRLYADSVQLDLGERYLMKSKRLMLAECRADILLKPNFIWVPARVVREAISQSAFLNIDLRSLLAVTPWESAAGVRGLTPASEDVRESLAAPVRPDVLGAIASRLTGRVSDARFVDLASLENWQLTGLQSASEPNLTDA